MDSRRPRSLDLILAILLVLLGLPSARSQRGADLFVFDAAQAGRAGVNVAIAESPSSILDNPAGLTRIEDEWRLDLTLRGFHPQLRYEDAFNPSGEESDRFIPAPYFAVAWDPVPGDTGLPGDWRLGAALLHVAGYEGELDLFTQDFPTGASARRDVDYVYTGFHTAAAYRLSREVSIGATISWTYSQLDLTQTLELPSETFRGQSPIPGFTWGELLLAPPIVIDRVRIEGDLNSEPTFGLAATFGLLWEASDTVTVGLAYRTPGLQQDYDVSVDVDISRIFGQPDPVTFPDGFAVSYDGEIVDFNYPQAFALGLAWQVHDDVRLATDLRWINWSATHDDLVIRLRNGDNPGFNAFVGSDSLRVTERLEFDDQLAAAVSVEWEFLDRWTVRAGFAAQTSAVPDRAVTPSAPAFAQLHTGFGIGYRGDGWSVDAAWLHTFARGADVGTSVVSSDLDGARVKFAADSFFVTFTLSF